MWQTVQSRMAFAISVVLLAACVVQSTAKAAGFLHELNVDKKAFTADIQSAMGAMLGCGGEVSKDRLESIELALRPMWQTLPKNSYGKVERRSLRHAVHRYFMQRSSMMIRGFEPSRLTNQSHWGVADILSQQVPAYVESVLESETAQQHGFTLPDAVHMVAMLEQLILDSDRAVLEKVYSDQRKPRDRALSMQGLKQVLEAYVVNWMLSDDPEAARILLANRTLLESTLPHWDGILSFVEGQARALEYKRQQTSPEAKRGHDVFSMRYSFEDVHEVVGGVTKSFASFWQSECASMETQLMHMDSYKTGRVPLSKFYGHALDTEWRFGESESYLREMGALDETSRWRGKQVIIPNYMQAASNCIVSTPHYLVCCMNHCESLLEEIELAIGAPTASPSELLEVVGNMTAQTTLEDDAPAHIDSSMKAQLEQAAASHGGRVPLHGRLFAQWMHYAFPRECPFPHKMGVAATVTPLQYGDAYIAKQDDMKKHASNTSDVHASMTKDELQWMSQWSPEEELRLDYSMELPTSWTQSYMLFLVVSLLLLGIGLYGGALSFTQKAGQKPRGPSMEFTKAHWV